MAKILVTFYSTFGHTAALGRAVAEGAQSVNGTEVRVRLIPELPQAKQAMSGSDFYVQTQTKLADEFEEVTHDDLRWADGIAWGTPTRFGNVSAQMKQFLDTLGPLWQKGELEDKATGIFTSTASIHGGQETTILTGLVPMLHLGMVFVGTPYGQNPQINTAEAVGGSPYGPSTIAGGDGSLQPKEADLTTSRNLGSRLAKVSERLKDMRG